MVPGDLLTIDIRVDRGPDDGHAVELWLGARKFAAGPLGPEALSVKTGEPDAAARLVMALLADPAVRGAWGVAAELHPRRRVRLRLDGAADELRALPWAALDVGSSEVAWEVSGALDRGSGVSEDRSKTAVGVASEGVSEDRSMTPQGPWAPLGADCRQMRVRREAGGNLAVFAARRDGSLWQRTALQGGGWDEWVRIPGEVEAFELAMDARGRLWVFAVDRRGGCWAAAQDAPYGQWGKSRRLGVAGTQVVAVSRPDGRIVACALDREDIHVGQQTAPGGSFGAWERLDGDCVRIVAARNGFGQPVLFRVTEEPAIHATIQRALGGAWDEWSEVAARATDLSVELGPDGRMHLACVDVEGRGRYTRESAPGLGWGEWEELGGTWRHVVGFFRSAGPYELHAIGGDGAVWRCLRSRGAWEPWVCVGGAGYVQLEAFEDAGGELQLFALTADGRIDHLAPSGARDG